MRSRGRFLWRGVPAAALAGLVAGLAGPVLMEWGGRRTLVGQATAIDGDSLRLGGVEIRLTGIDAPELAQTCGNGEAELACGQDARRALASRVSGEWVRCETEGMDTYGRNLARCFVRDGDIGAAMVRAGQAVNTGRYGAEQAEARTEKAGLWRTRFERPVDWRASHPREGGR